VWRTVWKLTSGNPALSAASRTRFNWREKEEAALKATLDWLMCLPEHRVVEELDQYNNETRLFLLDSLEEVIRERDEV